MSDLWLTLYAATLSVCGVLCIRYPRLALLSVLLAANALVFLFLPPLGEAGYLIAGLADFSTALLCVCLACRPASRVAMLACLGMVVNLGMSCWYQHPVPYELFMSVYNLYPDIIRGIELAQLIVIITEVPVFRRWARIKDKGEPPCQYLMVRPSRLL